MTPIRKTRVFIKNVDWSNVNLNQPLIQIAKETGLSISAAHCYRKNNLGPQAKRRMAWDAADLSLPAKEVARMLQVNVKQVYYERSRRRKLIPKKPVSLLRRFWNSLKTFLF